MNRVPLYAAHRIEDGLWEIIAPSDDPYTPAYWRVGVVRQHNRALRPSSTVTYPGNHVAIRRIWSQSSRKKDRTAR